MDKPTGKMLAGSPRLRRRMGLGDPRGDGAFDMDPGILYGSRVRSWRRAGMSRAKVETRNTWSS